MTFTILDKNIVLNQPVRLKPNDFDLNYIQLTYKPQQPGLPYELPGEWKKQVAIQHRYQMKDFSAREANGYAGDLVDYMHEYVFTNVDRPEWIQELEHTMSYNLKAEMDALATQAVDEYFKTGQYKEHVIGQTTANNLETHYIFDIPVHWYENVTLDDWFKNDWTDDAVLKNGKLAVAEGHNKEVPMGHCIFKVETDASIDPYSIDLDRVITQLEKAFTEREYNLEPVMLGYEEISKTTELGNWTKIERYELPGEWAITKKITNFPYQLPVTTYDFSHRDRVLSTNQHHTIIELLDKEDEHYAYFKLNDDHTIHQMPTLLLDFIRNPERIAKELKLVTLDD